MSKKLLINIRGTCAVGKTTAMRQYCERSGFTVETVETPFGKQLPISVINNGEIVVFGDYKKSANCCGADTYSNGKADLMDVFIEVCNKYDPDVIMYEYMLSSASSKGTIELAELAKLFGRHYYGVLFVISEERRLKNIEARRGKPGKPKTFDTSNVKRTISAAHRLKDAGLFIEIVNV